MKCPHCLEAFHEEWSRDQINRDNQNEYFMSSCICPSCGKSIIRLGIRNSSMSQIAWNFVYPKVASRIPIPPEVDDLILIADYNEACLVLPDSAKASAALSRRCLQHILKEKAAVTGGDLSAQIDLVIESGKLPTHLVENLDCVRSIGNFAAHPIKSKQSGEILDVEPGEAEWNLDVVEELMDFYFVKPAHSKARKVALNSKLREAGKPELPV